MRYPMPYLIIGLGLSLMLTAAQGQTTYRWVDQDGRVIYSDQPPPPSARQAEAKQLGAPNAIATGGPDYRTRMAAQVAPVTLYSSADCAAECKLARSLLRQYAIPHSEKSIKTAEDAAAYKKATGSENLLVPTLVVGGQVQKGYEDGAWRRLLEDAGYAVEAGNPNPGSR